jgi:UDP-glucose 4-epimerase
MPVSPYAVSKLATEQYALSWQQSFQLPTLPFRFFNVFGPYQAPDHAYAAVIPAFVAAALRGEPLVIHGDGHQSRDFTYVGTVCDVIVDAIKRGVASPQPVNLAFGTRVSLLEVVKLLEEIVGHSLTTRHVETRAGDVRHSQADNTQLRTLFPDVAPVSLVNGLVETVDWMRRRLHISEH